MNLDKHDLFRNAVPGFVFLVVILSFYAVTESLEDLNKGQGALLGLVAGFPLGFVIHSLYRIVFHVLLGEQSAIDREEAALVTNEVPEGSDREKAHRVWFELYRSAHEAWKERIGFLWSYVHALGAAALAVSLALLFMLTIKYPLFLGCGCCLSHTIPSEVKAISIFWVIVVIVFHLGRERVKSDCAVSMKTFWQLRNQ